MACVHINIDDIRPGMYIVQTGISWRSRPYLYAKPGLIKSEKEIEAIAKQGYLEAYYDPEKSQKIIPRPNDLLPRKPTAPATPLIPLHEELLIQNENYDNCVHQFTHVMEEARSGHVDFHAAKPLIEDIIKSVNRNADALVSLSKIKTFDTYTFAHCVNVSIFAVSFGRHLGLEGETLRDLGMAGLFHDIGKMKVPLAILNAPRKLTSSEYCSIQKHVDFSIDILSKTHGIDERIIQGVADHHERFNGTGYPHGKIDTEISPFGRILSICDVYDALSSRRVYKTALPPSQTLSIMYGMRDEAWESELLEHFIKMLGIYPVGTPIALTGGYKGIVVKSNTLAPLYPTVLLCKERNGKKINPPTAVDLAKQHDFQIIKAIPAEEISTDIFSLLTCAQ